MNRAADMAYRLLLRHGDHTLPVDPMAMLRRCRDAEILTERQAIERTGMADVLPLGADAVTFRAVLPDGRVCWQVVWRQGGDPARERFTLAHELGHIVLKHTGRTPQEEREADVFASHLLCPRPVLRMLASRGPLYAEQAMTLFFLSRAAVLHTEQDLRLDIDPVLARQVEDFFLPSIPDTLRVSRYTPLWHRLRVPGAS